MNNPLVQAAKAACNTQSPAFAPMQNFTSNVGIFQEKMQIATELSRSSLIPTSFRGKPADVMMAMELAEQMKMSLFVVTQNLDIIHGKISWKSTFVISAINSSKKFASPLRFEWKGQEGQQNWGCRVFVKEHNGAVLYGSWVTIQMANAEGWYQKDGSKWKTMPEQMLQYRAASFFGRLHASDILMGMQTTDEMIDVEPISVETVAANNEIEFVSELDALLQQVKTLGFEVSGPTEGNKGVYWIKATIKVENADVQGLLSLGFIPNKDFFVMNVTNLMQLS